MKRQYTNINTNVKLSGFFELENWGVWGNGKEYSIRFFNYSHQQAKLDVNVFLCDQHPTLETIVLVNGKKQANWVFEQGKAYPDTTLKLKPYRENTITFKVKNPVAPKDIIDSADDRLLGVGIKKMILQSRVQ